MEIINPLTRKRFDYLAGYSEKSGRDLYKLIARHLFGVPYNKVTPEQRSEAKKYTLTLLYLPLCVSEVRYIVVGTKKHVPYENEHKEQLFGKKQAENDGKPYYLACLKGRHGSALIGCYERKHSAKFNSVENAERAIAAVKGTRFELCCVGMRIEIYKEAEDV